MTSPIRRSSRLRRRTAPVTLAERASTNAKGFWTCPLCGRQFVSTNKYHSCGHYEVDIHFAGKDPNVRAIYDRLLQALERIGPVTIHAVKTRIVLQAETQFAIVMPRKHWLEGCLWLRRRAQHPLIRRIEMQVYRDYGHIFRLSSSADLDEALISLLQEAYVLGCQPLPRW